MSHSEQGRKIVMLTLTERCNLDCVYCFEKKKSNKTMTVEVAKGIVQNEFSTSDGFEEIEFDLFGGEPTLCIPVIKELVEWTESQYFPKPYLFFLETNGTLVHGEFQRWLVSHKDHVIAGLSLDGTPETHNQNRSNSYDKIDIEFFLQHYPEQPARMTIHSETVRNILRDIVHLHTLGFKNVEAVFAAGVAWDGEGVENDLKEELARLCNYYLDHPNIAECSIFDMFLPNIFLQRKAEDKWCGSGVSMISYDADGTKYPCHTFQSNTTTYHESIKLSEIDFEHVADFSDPECARCVIEPACPNCYGMNHTATGNFLKRDKRSCGIVKLRALAVSYLRAKQIERDSKGMQPSEIYQTINAIEVIQREFSPE